ncbi:MAG TPA: pseudaminic acid synthase [Isosphaeraceae bacterium]|nr:pseudaminic acid synthase [Isosphaeraceae bacterium]
MITPFEIGRRAIGPGRSVYVIAELSANHGQSFEQAVRLVRAAKEAGADAVKLQTYTADTITINSDRPEFRVGGGTLWDGRTLHDLYGEAYTPWEWQPKLKALADELGLDLFSTPFDPTAVEFLERMDVPAYKVASFELVDLPLIERIARTGKPMILSTGMATLAEIAEAVDAARRGGAVGLALLKCSSAYPAPPEAMNLRTIPHLAEAFGVPAGLSDHTLGIAVPVAAVALGACIIEKHFTLSRDEPGPDSAFSLEPAEFRAMVEGVHTAERALGAIHYGLSGQDEASRTFRRSLFVVEDVQAGEPFTERNVRSIRPGHGLPPKLLGEVLGRRAAQDLARGTPLHWGLIA